MKSRLEKILAILIAERDRAGEQVNNTENDTIYARYEEIEGCLDEAIEQVEAAIEAFRPQ